MPNFLKAGGYVLLGRGQYAEEDRELEDANRKALGSELAPLNIDATYEAHVRQRLGEEKSSDYGWYLYGARKSDRSSS